jgi:hypothetical protein
MACCAIANSLAYFQKITIVKRFIVHAHGLMQSEHFYQKENIDIKVHKETR